MSKRGVMKIKTKVGIWYEKWIEKWIPAYGVLSLISCFALNCLIYWGVQLATRNVKRYDFTTSFDRSVPFVTQWVYIYFICFAFWAINYILITREGRKPWFQFAVADMSSRIICGIIFILIPTTNVRPEIIGNSLSANLMRFLYWIDSPTNLFPSIHCLVSWFCFIGIRKSEKIPRWYKIFSCIFALFVCASTQFTKQHYIVDVISGIAIAELCFYLSHHNLLYKKLEEVFEKINLKVFGDFYGK